MKTGLGSGIFPSDSRIVNFQISNAALKSPAALLAAQTQMLVYVRANRAADLRMPRLELGTQHFPRNADT